LYLFNKSKKYYGGNDIIDKRNEKNYPNIQLVCGNVQQSYISEKFKMVNFSLVQCFHVENNINT